MSDIADLASLKKNDRSSYSAGGRLAVRILSALAPARAERLAAERFGTPVRPRHPADPAAPGLKAHRFDVEVGTGRLAAWEWGGDGPTVLLVHGWNGHAAQLQRFVAPLVERGYYVVAFDQPGHGQSTGERAHVVAFAEAVLAVARRVQPVHALIAHSLGGTGAALALARGLEIERAVLLAPPAEPRYFARAFAAMIGLPPARLDGMLGELRRELGDLDALDVRRLAPQMTAGLLLMHDPEDREVPFAHGSAIARAWPGARLEKLRRLGHRRLLVDASVIEQALDFVDGPGVRHLRRSA